MAILVCLTALLTLTSVAKGNEMESSPPGDSAPPPWSPPPQPMSGSCGSPGGTCGSANTRPWQTLPMPWSPQPQPQYQPWPMRQPRRQWNTRPAQRQPRSFNTRPWQQPQQQPWGSLPMPLPQSGLPRSMEPQLEDVGAEVPRYGSVGMDLPPNNVEVVPGQDRMMPPAVQPALPYGNMMPGQPMSAYGNMMPSQPSYGNMMGAQPSYGAPMGAQSYRPQYPKPLGCGYSGSTCGGNPRPWNTLPMPQPGSCGSTGGTCGNSAPQPQPWQTLPMQEPQPEPEAPQQPHIPDMSAPAPPQPQPWTRSYTPLQGQGGRCFSQCRNSCPLTQQPGYQQPTPSPCSRRPVCSTRCQNSQPRCPPRQPAWNQGPTTVCGLKQQQQQQQPWQAYGQQQQQAGQGWQAYGQQQMQTRPAAMQQDSGHAGHQQRQATAPVEAARELGLDEAAGGLEGPAGGLEGPGEYVGDSENEEPQE